MCVIPKPYSITKVNQAHSSVNMDSDGLKRLLIGYIIRMVVARTLYTVVSIIPLDQACQLTLLLETSGHQLYEISIVGGESKTEPIDRCLLMNFKDEEQEVTKQTNKIKIRHIFVHYRNIREDGNSGNCLFFLDTNIN